MKRNQKNDWRRPPRQTGARSFIEDLRQEWRYTYPKVSSFAIRLFHEMVRELTALPRVVKIFVAVGIITIFVVITQWEHFGFGGQGARTTLTQPAISKLPAPAQQVPADHLASSSLEDTEAEDAEVLRLKRMGRFIINDTRVNANGSIVSKDRTLYLYGIKPFNSKNICRRASGEPWACGLQAYAGLRNAIEHKTIICEPRKALADGFSVTCRIGTADIAATLVRNGLVELEGNIGDTELMNAQAFAKSQKLGIWDR